MLKKYRIEILLIVMYLVADNLHMLVEYKKYSPSWYVAPYQNYFFHDSVFYTFHYFSQAPLLMTFVLFISSPRDLNKVWLRFSLLIVSLRDFIGELFELLNINIPIFSNEGYNESCMIKIGFLIFAMIVAFNTKKMCMKLLNYLSSP